MNRLCKSWVHHPLHADELNEVTLAHRRLYIMHKFTSPWESRGTASLSKKSLPTLAARLGGPHLTWPLCESCRKYRKGLRLIDHLECHSLIYRACLGIPFWSAVVLWNIIFASMYAIKLLKSAGLRATFAFHTAEGKTWL